MTMGHSNNVAAHCASDFFLSDVVKLFLDIAQAKKQDARDHEKKFER